jgi:chromosome segregation ATPase
MESIEDLKKELAVVNQRVEQTLDIVLEHFKEQDSRIEELEEQLEDLKDGISTTFAE